MKKIIFALLIAAILLTVIPTVSFAGNTYYATGGIYDVGTCGAGYGDTIRVSGTVTLTGTNNSGIQIRCISSSNLTLDNLHVSLQETNIWDMCALSFESSTTSTITLVGSNVIKSGANEPGIKVLPSATLTISGSGSLLAKGGQGAAGIGSDSKGHSSGTVKITSGKITAEGGNFGGAGIGGGRQGGNGRLDILGGTVTAQGGYLGAGIGGGGVDEDDYIVGAGGIINISGGTVTAIGSRGAGIGTGSNMSNSSSVLLSSGTTITISGGAVDATGGRGGAGIGTGKESPSDCTINISGGVVHAKSTVLNFAGDESSWYAAGIGGGYISSASSVSITGGEVYAARSGYATGYGCSNDIGSGYNATGCTVSISGTAAVFLQDHMIENLSTSHTYVNNQTIMDNSAYGYTHFPSDWSGTAYGYLVRYSVYFNGNGSNGGSVPGRMYFYLSDTERKIPEPAAPNVPTRTGYTLDGWYTNMACTGTAWNFTNNQVNSNMTLYAKWTPINYAITYNNEYGAANTNPVSYTIADTPLALTDLTGRTGYTFDGWYDNAALSGSAVASIPSGSTVNKEYWAKWSLTNYPITYNNVNGAENSNLSTYTMEDPVIVLSDLSRIGYTFDGWYDNAECTGAALTVIPAGSIGAKQYWAKWTADEYTITYNNEYGEANTNPMSYTIVDTPITLTNLTGRTGYTFDGWYDNAAFSGSAVALIPAGNTGDKQYWAKWTADEYTITYNNEYGEANTNPMSYTIVDTPITLTNLTGRTGYTFDGWYDNAAFSGSAVTLIPSGSTVNKEYWAKWSLTNYPITYNNVNGVENSNPSTYTMEDPAILLSDLSRTGYGFGGWYDNAECTGVTVTIIPAGSTGAKQYWAKWATDEYTITYNNEYGAANTNPMSYTIIDTPITLSNLTRRIGYTFDGWYCEDSYENQVTKIPESTTGHIAFWAKWQPVEYDITYDLGGGSNGANPASYTVEDVVVFHDPSKVGYTFSGWYLDETFENSITRIERGHTGNIMLYAEWTAGAQEPTPIPSPSASIPTTSPSAPQNTITSRSVEEDDETGTVTIEIVVSDLPKGTVSIVLPSGEIKEIGSEATVQFTIPKSDFNESTVLITALDEEGLPLAKVSVNTAAETFAIPNVANAWSRIWPVLMWVLIGLALTGLAISVVYIILRSRKNTE